MRRRRLDYEDAHQPSEEEILEALDLLPCPDGEDRIALAIDANRCALKGDAPRTSAAGLRAMLEQMVNAGTVLRFDRRAFCPPELGPWWWSAAKAQEQAEERQAETERALAAETKRLPGQERREAEIAEALREERASGGSPLKKAVDATLEANQRMYREYRRRSGGEGGAN